MKIVMPDWRDTLKVGDVLISPTGSWRVVRAVSYWSEDNWCATRRGLLQSVTLSIKRCSWTGRAFTLKIRSDLARWQKLEGARAKLSTEADRKLLEDIRKYTTNHFTCCTVKHMI